jgi:thiamine-phosphate pyrophosphorylase
MQKIRLYCSTCARQDIGYEDQVEQACEGGAEAIQFRAATLSAREILTVGVHLIDICRSRKVLFILADRPDLALALNADGVHLGPNDIPTEWARHILGGRKIIGRSVSSLGQATTADREGVDYLLVGPVFSSTDQESRGVDIIRMVKERVKAQVLATGGMTPATVADAIIAGAEGISVGRAVCGAEFVKAAALEMKERIQKAIEERTRLS